MSGLSCAIKLAPVTCCLLPVKLWLLLTFVNIGLRELGTWVDHWLGPGAIEAEVLKNQVHVTCVGLNAYGFPAVFVTERHDPVEHPRLSDTMVPKSEAVGFPEVVLTPEGLAHFVNRLACP